MGWLEQFETFSALKLKLKITLVMVLNRSNFVWVWGMGTLLHLLWYKNIKNYYFRKSKIQLLYTMVLV